MTEPGVAAMDQLLEDCGSWLDRTTLLPDEASRSALAAQLDEVNAQRDRLRSPLYVVLVGGTGVGKSTLLNALAGEAIAQAGPVRPTTSAVTTYCHAANRLALPAELTAGAVAVHEREALRDKVVVDTPDLDSQERAHWSLMEQALRLADVVVWVTTAEKYADRADAGWLTRYRDGRRIVVVLNRADQGLPPGLIDDLRDRLDQIGLGEARVLTVSALRASAGQGDAGFDEFANLLSAELDAKQIRVLKSQNLAAAVRGWLALAAARVPADLDRRLSEWSGAAEDDFRRLTGELTQRLSGKLAADRRLAHHVEYWLGFDVGGPLGALLGALYGLRALVSPTYPRLWEVSEQPPIELAVSGDEAAALSDRLLAWQARHASRAVDLGLEAATRDWPKPDAPALKAAAVSLDASVSAALARALRGAQGASGWLQRALMLVLNVATLAVVIGLPAWLVVEAWAGWARGQAVYTPTWPVVVTTLLLWLVAAGWLAGRLVKVRAKRFLASLNEVTAQAVREALASRLTGRLETRLKALRESRAELEELSARSARPVAGLT